MKVIAILGIAWGLVSLIGLALWLDNGRRDYNRATRPDEPIDVDPHFDKVCDLGDLTQHFPTDGLPAESSLDIFEHTAMTVEFFPQLQAEEANQ